jgi:hypothetical protein
MYFLLHVCLERNERVPVASITTRIWAIFGGQKREMYLIQEFEQWILLERNYIYVFDHKERNSGGMLGRASL